MNSLKGHLLVAAPSLVDPNFCRTVILMLEHNDEGAAGVVLNRLSGHSIRDVAAKVFPEPVEWDKPIHIGGPVPGPLMAIHTEESLGEREVFEGLYSTIESERLQQIVGLRPEPSLLVANYAGWGPGQLEAEFDVGSWHTLPARVEHVGWDAEEDLWGAVMSEIGREQLKSMLDLGDFPNDPTLN